MPLRNLSIKRKLIAVTVLSTGATLLLVAVAFAAYSVHTYRQTLIRQLTTQAEIVGFNSEPALVFHDEKSAAETLAALRAEPQITFAGIYTPDGRPFATYVRADWAQKPPVIASAALAVAPIPGLEFSGDTLVLTRLIGPAKRPLGTVRLRADLTELKEKMIQYGGITGLVFLVSLVAAVGIGSALQKTVSEPVLDLVRTARKVTLEKDYGVRATVRHQDELGVLVEAFNEMLSQIQRRDADLVHTTRTLETEVAERRRAEGAHEQSEERFRRAFSVSPVPTSLSEAKTGRFVDVNESFARLLGYTREELIGKSAVELGIWVDAADRREIVKSIGEALPVRGRETRLRTKAGEIRHVLGAVEPLAVGDDTVFLSVLQDITERKQSEQALKRSEARKRAVLEASLDSIITIDEKGLIIEVNPATEKTFGYTASEMVGKELAGLIVPPRLREEYRDGLVRQTASGEAHVLGRVLEMPAQRRDGTEFPTELFISRVDVEGAPHFVGYIRDVTEHRQLEEQLRQSQKMEAVGQLAGGVAHDFNNLLTVIIGNADIQQSMIEKESPLAESLEEIRKAADRAAALTRQLLAFSRRQVLEPKVLDVNALVENVEKMLRRLIGEDVKLMTLLSPSIGRVRADAGQLEQIVVNLSVNARDAMPKGGTLTIETADVELDEQYAREHLTVRPGTYVMIAVTDTGAGMSPETQSRIFEPFFTTKGTGKGTGLGLATVYGIVKQSGGSIWVYSEIGKGTTFKIYFPLVQEGVQEKKPALGERSVGGHETVLLVEDEPAVRKLSQLVLAAQGYTVIEAAGAEQALALAKTHVGPIHLILTDVVMPEMGGADLASRLSALHPETRVLYMSGYTDDAIVRKGLIDVGRHFLQKPFTPALLAKKVRDVLDE
jgi:PAS domain S-box-containing protein